MTKEEHIKYWLDSADHDLDVATTLFEAEKYDWALYLGHIVLEKTIKAIYVQNNDNKIPPKIHNLVRLAEVALIKINEKEKIILDIINDFNLEVRYPEFKNEFYKICTKEFAEENLYLIKEFYQWLKSQIK